MNKYNNWEDLVKNRPLHVGLKIGGLPRTGTTVSYWNLAELIKKFRPDIGGCYEYWNNMTELELDKKYNVLRISGFDYSKNPSDPASQAELEKRIRLIKQYNHTNHFFKTFPHEYGILRSIDEELATDIVTNNHWLFFLRQDFVRVFCSWYYSSATNVWHYSADDTLIEVDPVDKLDPERTFQWQRNLVLLNEMAIKSHSHRVIYTHEISHLPKLRKTLKIDERTDKNKVYDKMFEKIHNLDDFLYELTSRTIKNQNLEFLTIDDGKLKMKDKLN